MAQKNDVDGGRSVGMSNKTLSVSLRLKRREGVRLKGHRVKLHLPWILNYLGLVTGAFTIMVLVIEVGPLIIEIEQAVCVLVRRTPRLGPQAQKPSVEGLKNDKDKGNNGEILRQMPISS